MRHAPLSLDWLPPCADFAANLAAARQALDDDPAKGMQALRQLANHSLDFVQTDRLARVLDGVALAPDAPALRLAVGGSLTVDHLVPGLRVAALRRGLDLDVFVPPYAQWRQHLLDPGSTLRRFRPDAVLICAEAAEFLPRLPLGASRGDVDAAVRARVGEIVAEWRAIRDQIGAVAIQQIPLQGIAPLFGHHDRLVPAAPGALFAEMEHQLVRAAADEGVLIFDPGAAARDAGLDALHDRRLWLHARQHIGPAAAPWFGDQVARVLAALRGLSRKVLVLDLDNTLWGGVLGDDGLDGIVIGEGSARGEAFKAFQSYAKALRERGILLAVSSKNDPQRAEAAFDHPEMVLRRSDFAVFVADWNDKATGLQRIAQTLNLGLDALVFFDDNPAERALVRQALPQVAVPEVPEAPEDYMACLTRAGYFEAVAHTPDDMRRAQQYAENAERQQLAAVAPDMDTFLRGLQMKMQVSPIDNVDLVRVTQLINKTNQFNLTTRRYTRSEVQALVAAPDVLSFCVRLTDRFGDNGIISVVIGRLVRDGEAAEVLDLDTWLMSCRVLGRRVEEAVSHVVASAARGAGATRLIGHYRPSARNEIVADLFSRLGFAQVGVDASGQTTWTLPLDPLPPPPPPHIRLTTKTRIAESLT